MLRREAGRWQDSGSGGEAVDLGGWQCMSCWWPLLKVTIRKNWNFIPAMLELLKKKKTVLQRETPKLKSSISCLLSDLGNLFNFFELSQTLASGDPMSNFSIRSNGYILIMILIPFLAHLSCEELSHCGSPWPPKQCLLLYAISSLNEIMETDHRHREETNVNPSTGERATLNC